MAKRESGAILKQRTSRKIYIPFYLMAIALIIILFYIKYLGKEINHTAFILSIIFIILIIKFTEVDRLRNSYKIKKHTLLHTFGLLNKRNKSIDLFAISDLDVDQTFWQRILNYGDVNIRLFSKDSTTIVKSINKPNEFAHLLEMQMNHNRKETK